MKNVKNGKYFIYEDEKTGERFIAKDFVCLKNLLCYLGFTKSEKHIRHCYNQIGLIDVNDMSLNLFMENSQVISMLRNYIEKQKD